VETAELRGFDGSCQSARLSVDSHRPGIFPGHLEILGVWRFAGPVSIAPANTKTS